MAHVDVQGSAYSSPQWDTTREKPGRARVANDAGADPDAPDIRLAIPREHGELQVDAGGMTAR